MKIATLCFRTSLFINISTEGASLYCEIFGFIFSL